MSTHCYHSICLPDWVVEIAQGVVGFNEYFIGY